MSMALALEYTCEWLRTKNTWVAQQCGITYNAEPALDAGKFFVGIDDSGVETGDERTDALTEIMNLTIVFWRRPEHFLKVRRGLIKTNNDPYIVGAYTLHDIERLIIVPRLNGLHLNYTFLADLNTYFALPHDDLGASFITPLVYRGRSRMESIILPSTNGDGQAWLGYRLRFRGLQRTQKLRGVTDASG